MLTPDSFAISQFAALDGARRSRKLSTRFLRQPLTRRSGRIKELIRFGAKVAAIDVGGDKVTIGYDDDGRARALTADYCLSTIPMPIFKTLRPNLPPAFLKAAETLPVQAAGKVGFQAERFWETRDQIFGGISWTTDVIAQIWYPSHHYLSRTGTLTGAYMYGAPAEAFNALPVAERLRLAKEQGEKLHADYGKLVSSLAAQARGNIVRGPAEQKLADLIKFEEFRLQAIDSFRAAKGTAPPDKALLDLGLGLLGKASAKEPIGRPRVVEGALWRRAEQLRCSVEPVQLDENGAGLFGAASPHRREGAFDVAAPDIGRNPDCRFEAHSFTVLVPERNASEAMHCRCGWHEKAVARVPSR